jgi:hypothetical protein
LIKMEMWDGWGGGELRDWGKHKAGEQGAMREATGEVF